MAACMGIEVTNILIRSCCIYINMDGVINATNEHCRSNREKCRNATYMYIIPKTENFANHPLQREQGQPLVLEVIRV